MKGLKRILLVMIAIMATVSSANAQFKWGIKAGLNVNKIHFHNNSVAQYLDKNNSVGWTAGLMAEYTIPVIGLSIDAGLMYARMNNEADDAIYETDNDGTIVESGKIFGRNFLEIPVNLKYKFSIPVISGFLKPYIFTGPNFAFRLDKNVFSDIKTHTCELAWNVGLGVELISHVQIGASYGFGITDQFSKTVGWDNTAGNLKAKNNYWTITAAYLF